MRLAATPADLARTDRLRAERFRYGRARSDRDDADPRCIQVMVEDDATGALWCTFRVMLLPNGSRIGDSYSAGYYGLEGLAGYAAPMAEVGRFCLGCPPDREADVLRAAFAALTRIVDAHGVGLMFGCSSFAGTDAQRYGPAFALLHDRYVAPLAWLPRIKAPRVVRFGQDAVARVLDLRAALAAMPPLLRHYLTLGGWVSDHAVIDDDLGTTHVFTGVEVAAIPPARARSLRRLAYGAA